VVTDDIALPTGKIRLRIKGGAGGHNGLKSIEEIYGQDYARLRIGVGGGYQKEQQADYVLSDFSAEEMKEMKPSFEKAMNCIYAISSLGFDKAMTEFNK
jgi:PTH1 family peptidyl-tRNA hydrolase